MDKFLAVTDKNSAYGERLCEFLNERRALPATAVSFSDPAGYMEFSRSHNVILHLLDRDTLESCRNEAAGAKEPPIYIDEKTVLLLGSELEQSLEGEDRNAIFVPEERGIYKYRSADEIFRSLMEIYGRISGKLRYVSNTERAKIIGVYSPIGGSGKTILSLLIAELSAAERKVLYLNLEEFSGFFAVSGEECEEDISEVLYYLKEDSLDFAKLKSLVRSIKSFDYIPPAAYPEDTGTAEAGDYVGLVELITEISEYELIVIDMQGFAAAASELMELCDVIYMPVRDDPVSKEKIRSFERYMENSKRFRVMERIEKVRLPEAGPLLPGTDIIGGLLYSPAGDMVRELITVS